MNITCKHCGTVFNKIPKPGTLPTTCDGCNRRRKYPKFRDPAARSACNKRYREKKAYRPAWKDAVDFVDFLLCRN